jgi:hypothetical protein
MTEPANNARATGPALEAMYQVLLWLIPTVEKFPRKQKFVLGDRIESTALDVLELLIGATYTKSRDKMLTEANLGLERLRFFMRLSFELRSRMNNVLFPLRARMHADRQLHPLTEQRQDRH